MYLAIDQIKALAQKTDAKLISFKFIDLWGRLSQIDSLISSLNFKDNNILICGLTLAPIENKIFLDPFRSFPTIFCLCENLTAESTRMAFIDTLETDSLQNSYLECAIEFTALNKANANIEINYGSFDQHNFAAEPIDKLANLRAEIVLALEAACISPTHHHSIGPFQSVIGFKAKDFLELADNYIIAKYIIANMAESYGKSVDFANSSKNKALESAVTITSSCNEKLFVEGLNDIIKNGFKGKLSFLKLITSNPTQADNNTKNKFVIGFDNPKINPYIVFSFLNPSNYKSDNIINDSLNKEEIKKYMESYII